MLYLIPTPIGNLEDISQRTLKILQSSSILFCEDTRVAKRLIQLLQDRYSLTISPKQYISMHSHNEESLLEKLDPKIFDQNIAYLSDAGMPCLSDPGCKLVEYCQERGIAYEVIPGANAALLAYAASGFCETSFLFFGFLPHKGRERKEALQEVLFCGYTAILYESPHRIIKLIEELAAVVPQREIFLIKEATKRYETKLKAKAEKLVIDIKNINYKGEWVVVVEAEKRDGGVITLDDILQLDLPKKEASKLIAKLTGKTPKACYQELLKGTSKPSIN